MDVLATDTEQLIKDTAKRVFFVEGRLHATTQDIADAAGINRASIHYYFRSRQLLFDKVFKEAVHEMQEKMNIVFEEGITFRERTERFIETFIQRSLEQPYLEMFIITEYNTNHDLKLIMVRPPDERKKLSHLRSGLAAEIAAGKMKPITAEHFMMTIMSLCSFPFLAQNIFKTVFEADEKAYSKLIMERKAVILKLLFLED
jgi:TetR/AcrR family transcriptional regulator